MKTKLIILFLLFGLCLNAQPNFNVQPFNLSSNFNVQPFNLSSNTIYVSVQPVNKGLGIRYDKFFNKFGSYVALSNKNEFKWKDKDSDYYIKDHIKLTTGLLYKLPAFKPEEYQNYIGIGLIYNNYGETLVPLNSIVLNTWSFELSTNIKIYDIFNIGIRYDPIKSESTLDFGYSF
jgi:hypothetical protein